MQRYPKFTNDAPAELSRWLREGDRILIGQGSGEPVNLMRLLGHVSQRIPRLTALIGTTLGDLPHASSALHFESYGAMGTASKIPQDALTILPLHYSQYIAMIVDGRLSVDVVFVQLSEPDDAGRFYLGMGDLHLIEAARRARVVIAEINSQTPQTRGTVWPEEISIHAAIEAMASPLAPARESQDKTDLGIAANVAELIPDRAVIQLGIGRLPGGIAMALSGHADLGLHSGVLSDSVVELVRCGALTNARKEIDTGVSVAGVLIGGASTLQHAANDAATEIRPTSDTHSSSKIAKLSRFHAINSAIEVDLIGQVNAETIGKRRVGGCGGQIDFTRAAQVSAGGRAIIALASTARNGTVSRIVPRASSITVAKNDADTIVTEWGVAELAGQSLDERARRLTEIAAPQFRENLARYWHDEGRQLDG